MNVKDIPFKKITGHMIQKTSDLALTVNLTQKESPPLEKAHDVDDCLAIWFSSVKLQLKIKKSFY